MINLAIGLITPPIGINLFVAANITNLPLERIARGALPFLHTSLVGLAVVAAFPELSLFLVDMMRCAATPVPASMFHSTEERRIGNEWDVRGDRGGRRILKKTKKKP